MRLMPIIMGAAIAAVPRPAAAGPAPAGLPPLGVNLSGCEFNAKIQPGVEGKDYSCPSPALIDLAAAEGVRLVRLPILAERVQPTIDGPLPPHAEVVRRVIDRALARGMTVVIDWHDYGHRAHVAVGTAPWTAAAFVDLNRRLLDRYRANPRVWISLQNEPHVPADVWWPWVQAAADGLRAAGFTAKLIVSGTGSSAAARWSNSSNGRLAVGFRDSNYAFDLHLYLDKTAAGSSTYCAPRASHRLLGALAWARQTHRPIFLGEWAAGQSEGCRPVLADTIRIMRDEGGGILAGAAWWTMSDWMRYPRYPYGLSGPGKAVPSKVLERLKAAWAGG